MYNIISTKQKIISICIEDNKIIDNYCPNLYKPSTDIIVKAVTIILHCLIWSHSNDIINIKEMECFLFNLLKISKMESKYCIIALVYFNRYYVNCDNDSIITFSNWAYLFFVAIMTANKVWNDYPIKCRQYKPIWNKLVSGCERKYLYPSVCLIHIDTKDFCTLEMNFLTTIKFECNIVPSLYAYFYFELISLFKKNINTTKEQKSRQRRNSIN